MLTNRKYSKRELAVADEKIPVLGVALLLLWGLLLVQTYQGGSSELLAAGLGVTGQARFYLVLLLAIQSLIIIFLLPHVRWQKQARQALRGSEERFKAAAAAISDALVAINDQGLVVLFNPAAERLFGYTREQMLGQTLDGLLPKRYRERHRQALTDYFAGSSNSRVFGSPLELPALRADGKEIVVELSLFIFRRRFPHCVGILSGYFAAQGR